MTDTRLHVGDYVKRTRNLVWTELDPDKVYVVTEVSPAGDGDAGYAEEIRLMGVGDKWSNFFYTGEYFDRVNGKGDVIYDNTAIGSGERLVVNWVPQPEEDVVTVQQVEVGGIVKINYGNTASLKDTPTPEPVDVVNHPSHYKFDNGVEVIDLTEQLNFNCGNVVKYTARAGRKVATKQLEDLRKAEFYIKREIKRVETAGENL